MGKRTIGTLNGGKPTVIWKDQIAAQESPTWREIDESKLELILCPECDTPRRITEFVAGLKRCKYCQSKRMQAGKKAVAPPLPPPPPDRPQTWMCSGCKRTLPLTAEFFYRATERPTGFRSNCKDCVAGRTVRKPEDVSTEPWEAIPTKLCSKCQKRYPATLGYFHRNRTKPGGLQSWCKTCANPQRNKRRGVVSVGVETRYCDWCKKSKPLTLEHFRKGTRAGFEPHCRDCRVTRQHLLAQGKVRPLRIRANSRYAPPARTKRTPLWRRIWRYLMGHKVV